MAQLPLLSLNLVFKVYLNERASHQFILNIPSDSPLSDFLDTITWYTGWKIDTKVVRFGDKKTKLQPMDIALPDTLRLLQERLLARQKKGTKRITGRETLELLSQINKELRK